MYDFIGPKEPCVA